jgi:hypothetical protein
MTPARTAVLDEFEDRLATLWARDAIVVDDAAGTARLVRQLIQDDGTDSPAAARVLADTGVRWQWNARLATDRASCLAEWLVPHVTPPVVDVLGGDFTVLSALVAAGLAADRVVGCERIAAYDINVASLPFPCHDLGDGLAVPDAAGGTALLSTVLHHESSPEALLGAVALTRTRRWLVVENCLDERNGPEFHLLIDEFFNRCLNHFDVPCVTQHRTAKAWRSLLSRYGSVSYEAERVDVPGIPFPYTLFIVDR